MKVELISKYEFCKNFSIISIFFTFNNLIQKSYNTYDYLKVCSTLANKVLKYFGLNEWIEMNNHKASEELIKTYLNDEKEEHVLLKIFNRILSSPKDENENLIIREKDKLSKRIRDEIQNKSEFDPTKDIVNQVSKNERFIRPLLDIVSENIVPRKEIKVIEINLSNAIMAIEVDNYLASPAIYPITVGYTIVNNSIQNLNEDLKNKDYELLEWNPNEISFPHNIQAADLFVYRDTSNFWDLKLDNFLQEIYRKVKDKGFFLTVFRYKFTAPEIVLNRLLEQKIVKDYNLTKRIDEFRNKAQKIGFNVVCYKSDLIGSIAILFRKVQPMKDLKPKKQNIIEITADYEKWFEILKEKFHEMKENDSKDEKIWLIANDSLINGILGFVLCLRLEVGGERIRCLFDYNRKLKLPLNFSEYPLSEILINDLAVNVIRDGKLGTYRHLNLTKSDDQFEGNDYYLNIGQRGDLTTLQWYDLKNMVSVKYINDEKLGKVNQIKCKVYFSGLNFKDVLIASGNYVSFEISRTNCILSKFMWNNKMFFNYS
jgi:fatty acid synthase